MVLVTEQALAAPGETRVVGYGQRDFLPFHEKAILKAC